MREDCPKTILYTKLIPRIDYKTVYRKTKDSWIKLNNAHFNTGFIEKHLSGYQTFGYTFYRGISRTAIIDIDAHTEEDKYTVFDRYTQIVEILGKPSFAVRSSGSNGIHMYYIFEPLYYIKDLKASILPLLSHIRGIDILPNGSSNIRLPFGKGSNLLDLDNPEIDYSNLSKEKQIEIAYQYLNIYNKLEDVCKTHIKTVRPNDCQFEEIKAEFKGISSKSINSNHNSVGFYAGNRLNSLIQLFNESKSKEEFLAMAERERKRLHVYSHPSKDLYHLDYDRATSHFEKFYDGMLKARNKTISNNPITKYKPNDTLKTKLSQYHIVKIRKWIMSIPEFKSVQIRGLSQHVSKKRFLSFSVKIINEFLKQCIAFPNKESYALPSTYMHSLDSYYNVFWSILIKYISNIDKDYYHNTVYYRCREYNLNIFKSFIFNIIKYKSLDINYYKYDPESSAPLQLHKNHYNILPDLYSRFKKKGEIMRYMGYLMERNRTPFGGWEVKWIPEYGVWNKEAEDVFDEPHRKG